MTDDQAPPPEPPVEQNTSSTGQAIAESTPVEEAGAAGEPSEQVGELVQESVAESQSEPPPPEPTSAPATPGVAAAPSAPSAVATNTPEHDRELLVKARAKIETIKQQKLAKVLGLFDTKEEITNDDVEKLLRCSDATALRYLNELIKQGKIQRVGKTGAGVVYIKT